MTHSEEMQESCPKCGGHKVHTAFHKNGGTSSLNHGCGWNRFERRDDQHLHFTCQTCSYDWTGDCRGR